MERAGCRARLRQPGAIGFCGGRLRRGRRGAILGRSVTETAREALTWVLPRDGEASSRRRSTMRAFRLLVATVIPAFCTPANVSDGVAPDPVEQRRAT